MKTRFWLLPLILLMLVLTAALCLAALPEVKFIDRDTLKGMLGDPDLLIIDARMVLNWPGAIGRLKGLCVSLQRVLLPGPRCCRKIEKSSSTVLDPMNIPASGWRGN